MNDGQAVVLTPVAPSVPGTSTYAAPMTGAREGRETAVVRAERFVAGGAALARRTDGRIVLVDDALPGELVEVTIGTRHGAERGTIVRIIEPSADRITPMCPHAAEGCGGCDLATLEPAAQPLAKVEIVADAFRRIGRWTDPVVRPGPSLDPWGFRTTLRRDGHQRSRRVAPCRQ